MTRPKPGLLLVATGVILGAGIVVVREARAPTAVEIAQRACLAAVAHTARQSDDDGALAAQAAECSTQDL